MPLVKPEPGELNWHIDLNAALDFLDGEAAQAKADAANALSTANTAQSTANAAASDAATALSTAQAAQNTANAAETPLGAQNKANTAEANAKAYADAGDAALDTRIDALETASTSDWGKTINLPDSQTQYRQVNVPDDLTNVSTWPDRFAFYFNGTRTGYFNEYGELRARPAKTNTVAFRAMAHASGSTGNVFEVGPSVQPSTPYFRVSQTIAEASTPLSTTQYLVVNGVRVYVGPTDPGAVPDGSIWIDTS